MIEHVMQAVMNLCDHLYVLAEGRMIAEGNPVTVCADPLVIEAQLAHAVKDTNGRAYNRTTFLKQRADMMQRWCDFLDKLAAGADVIEFRPKAA